MKITKENLPLFAEPTEIARHKSCEVHLARFGKELNIQYIKSQYEGKRHATEMIEELLKYCEKNELTLASSTPISEGWRRLCKKFNLKVYEDETKTTKI